MLDGLLEHTRELESIKESRDKIKKLEKKVKDLEMKVMEMMKTLSHQRLDDQEKEQGVSGARGDNTNLTYLDTAQVWYICIYSSIEVILNMLVII